MDYQQFCALRDRLVAESNPLRLDCMNPAKALSAMAPPRPTATATVAEARQTWLSLFAPDANAELATVTTGVRSALRVAFAHLAAMRYELWLPEDVYPEYTRLAISAGLPCRFIVTLPEPDFTPLDAAGPNAALLLPQPLAPLGRSLRDDEFDLLRRWLRESPQRRLLLDAVYHFGNRLAPAVRFLWDEKQTYVLHSIAKAWLLPDTLGILLAPPGDAASLKSSDEEPTAEAAGCAVDALQRWPNLPLEVEAACRRRWTALAERIRTVVPRWMAPATGYFAVVPLAFEELLRRGMLGVPASVFGSRRDDLTVISCLYYPE